MNKKQTNKQNMIVDRFPKAKTIEKYYIEWKKERFKTFRNVQIFSILETIFINNKKDTLNLIFVKEKISEYKSIKKLLKNGLRRWIKENNLTDIYTISQKEEWNEDLNKMEIVEYLNRHGNDYLDNLFSNLKKDIELVPFPELEKIQKNSFKVPFNWVFSNDNIEYKEIYENKDYRNQMKSRIDYQKLSQSLIKYKTIYFMDTETYERKWKYFNYLKNIMRKNGINNEIYFTGSYYTQLALKESDIDIYIKTSNEEENFSILQKLGIVFTDLGMKDTNVITDIKTNSRLCKFFDEKENINVDISANFNGLSKNLQLFKIYTQIDERFKILALIIKYWAKQRYIDKGDVIERMINSYTYILLLIFFLQIQQPPILPSSESLQEEINKLNELSTREQQKYNNIEGFKEEKEKEDEILSSITETINFDSNLNTKSIGELLIEFFEYYGFEFQYSENVISPRKGHILSKKEKNWDKCLMAIEDPILYKLNKGGILFPWCFEGIINEFKLTFVKLTEYQMNFFEEICQPVKEINYLPSLVCPPVDINYKRKILEDYVKSLKE